MSRSIQVYLGETPRLLGIIRHDAKNGRESASFEYDQSWLTASDRFSIDPTLPLVSGPQFHRKGANGNVFHSAITDIEPDGWGRRVILRDRAKQRQRTRLSSDTTTDAKENANGPRLFNALDFLLAVDDVSRVGALRLRDEKGIFQRATAEGHRTTPPLIELGHLLSATRAVENNSESAADLAYLRGHGTSLGGLRPKCTVVDDDGRLSIGKFPSITDERAVTKGEVLALHLAKAAGISAATARLVESDGSPVALIRRFDRLPDGERLLYVSAATMLGVERDDPTEHCYTEIADAIRIHGAAVMHDIEELWRRIAFSILITNVDDHLCNHGFLHATHGQWRLAPAFDINPFPERVRELKTWISEETGPEATIASLLSITSYFQISSSRAKEILQEIETTLATWRKTGQRLGMSKIELDQFAEAFEHSERIAARRAIASGK